MNMTEKNGQPSMEEILASIRRIIAEEPASHPHNGELRGTPIMLKGDTALEDASEFDLPAIFRSSPPATSERQAPLLGRLTDAIRSATTSQPEASAEEHRVPEPAEAGAGAVNGAYAGLSSLKSAQGHDAGSSQPARIMNGASSGHEPRPLPAAGTSGAAPATASAAPPDDEPKRIMTPFKDTHFMRMSSASTGVAPSPEPAPAPAPAPLPAALPSEPPEPLDFSAVVPPGAIDHAPLVNGAAVPHAFAPGEPVSAQRAPQAAPVFMPPPPPLPQTDPIHQALVAVPPPGTEGTDTIEDTTADLLRPMLRQWLADNMPRMVEKALHIEIAESLKGPKKT